jgi:hypothetical protein
MHWLITTTAMLTQMLAELLLSLEKFTTTRKPNTEQR